MALLGLAGAVAAPLYAARYGLGWTEVLLFVCCYWPTYGLGICVGFHRHFSHGAFRAPRAVRYALGALGSMGGQGPLTYWAATHRRHHGHADQDGDPHSPNLHGPGLAGTLRGLWHGHFGWTRDFGMPNAAYYCPDLVREPYLMALSRRYRWWVAAGLALPTLAGGLALGGNRGLLAGLVFGGLLRLFVSSNSTWSLNSICHRFGSRTFECRDQSTNVAWLALPTMGESWHNNHHAHPSSAAHGLAWWQLDLNWLSIRALELLGLVHDVKRPQAGSQTRTQRQLRTGSR